MSKCARSPESESECTTQKSKEYKVKFSTACEKVMKETVFCVCVRTCVHACVYIYVYADFSPFIQVLYRSI